MAPQRGILSLRGDVGFLGYGQESFHVPLSTTVGGRVQVKVSTTTRGKATAPENGERGAIS